MAQAKKEILPTTKLNIDVITKISNFLPLILCRASRNTNEQKNLLLSSLARYAAAGNVSQVARLVTIRPELRTQVLFTLAGLGAQDQMEPLLKQRPEDLLVYRPLRDISGAQFEHISLFQHALWTKDVRVYGEANMMLNCLPQNEQGETIRLEMVRQYEELLSQGVVYQLKGMMHREHHFSLQALITALNTHVTESNNWTEPQRQLHWCTVVGLAQTLLPAHIRHHYCDPDESFCKKPNFNKPKLTRSLEIYNWLAHKNQLWAEGLTGLGLDFGIYDAQGRRQWVRGGVALVDLRALKALDEMRTSFDMPALIERLYTPMYTPIQTTKLNIDVITKISNFLPLILCRASRNTNEQKNLLLSSLARYAAAGNVSQVARLVTIRPELRTQVLFTLAGLGAQDQMEPLLKQRPEDLLVYRPLRDISGAQFEHISLFQHALWTKDVRYMANMMLNCLPQNEQGETIRLEMVRQYEELLSQGVVYQLKGMMHREHHFSLQALITVLNTHVTESNNWTEPQRQLHWCTVVGLAQTLLPAHIRHHYCDPDESFCKKPNFNKPKLTRSLEIYNWLAHKNQLWAEGLTGLGLDFGIYDAQGRRQWVEGRSCPR